MLRFLNICNILLSLTKIRKTMGENTKQVRTVVHLEKDGKHYYYGNLKALGKDAIGVSYAYLKNLNISEDNPYRNEKCAIRRGTIITSMRKLETNT